MSDLPIVFISYASPDRDRVVPYFDRLLSRGYGVWMDCKRLKAGQNWDFEVRRALDKAAMILVFVSKHSVDRRGYVQREIKLALDKLDEKLATDIYIIPIVLDEDAVIPDQLKNIHCVKTWEADYNAKIDDAIDHQLKVIGADVRAVQDRARLSWSMTTYKELWEGLPGYEAEYTLPQFSSTQYLKVADITTFLQGELTALLMEQRRTKFEQSSQHMNFGQPRPLRTNTFDAYCSDPIITERVISIPCTVHWYNAGAAHPNMYFRTYSFFLDPVVPIRFLREAFEDPDGALQLIQSVVREQLLEPPSDKGGEPLGFDKEWVEHGTKDWESFRSFLFHEAEIEILFPPYQVIYYAAGPQFASIRYEAIAALMREEYAEALGVRASSVEGATSSAIRPRRFSARRRRRRDGH